MRPLPAELGPILTILINSASASAQHFIRDASTPCAGEFAPLNLNGVSPGGIYEQLQQQCTTVDTNPPLCRCNLVAYNLNSASELCQESSPVPWPTWAQNNQCPNSTGVPSSTIPYDTSSISIPQWAREGLASNQTFNLSAALKQAHGWSAIQIATPIIVGVGIITLAIAAFLIYRHRKYNHSSGGKRRQKPWESAHLHGPRRFFGLLPDRFTVRSRPTKEPQWEIDEQALQDTNLEPSPSSQGAASNNQSRPDMHSMHLRTTSTTSLISNMSHGTANRSRSIFSALTSKFNVFSPRDYSSGTTKGPDYKRVQVRFEHPDRRFKIDGGELTPRESAFNFPPTLPPSPPPPERRDTLPSVLDIRRPSTAGGSRAGGQARNGSLPTTYYDDRTDLTSPIAPKSDYSLRTTDLQTPTSLSGSVPGAPFAPRHESVVSPGSPFVPSARYEGFNALTQSVQGSSPFAHRRNQSTDSMSFELYPRVPR